MILVTGGTGYIGRHLVSALLRRGTAVRVLVRQPARALVLPPGVETVPGNLDDVASLAAAVEGVRAVAHLAAATAATAPDEPALVATNARGTESLVKAARASSVDHLVYVSSAGVYGIRDTLEPITERDAPSPSTPYQRAKLAGEEAVRAHAASWTVLRPSDVFGPARPQTAAFLQSVRDRRFWLHTGATTFENPAYVHDVVAAILAALDNPALSGETINVAGPRVLTHREVVDISATALGRRMTHITLPGAVTRSAAAIVAGAGALAGRSVPPRVALMKQRVINRAISTEKARALGLSMTPLAHAMAEVVAVDGTGRTRGS